MQRAGDPLRQSLKSGIGIIDDTVPIPLPDSAFQGLQHVQPQAQHADQGPVLREGWWLFDIYEGWHPGCLSEKRQGPG